MLSHPQVLHRGSSGMRIILGGDMVHNLLTVPRRKCKGPTGITIYIFNGRPRVFFKSRVKKSRSHALMRKIRGN